MKALDSLWSSFKSPTSTSAKEILPLISVACEALVTFLRMIVWGLSHEASPLHRQLPGHRQFFFEDWENRFWESLLFGDLGGGRHLFWLLNMTQF